MSKRYRSWQMAGNTASRRESGMTRLLLQSYGVWRLGEILCRASDCSVSLGSFVCSIDRF